MAAKIPFTADAWQTFRTVLGGVEYTFVANYNDRNSVWSFDLYLTKTEQLLVAGVAILIGCDLLAPYALGIGSMIAVDLNAAPAPQLIGDTGVVGPMLQSTDAGPDDLGTRVIVVYFTPAELGR